MFNSPKYGSRNQIPHVTDRFIRSYEFRKKIMEIKKTQKQQLDSLTLRFKPPPPIVIEAPKPKKTQSLIKQSPSLYRLVSKIDKMIDQTSTIRDDINRLFASTRRTRNELKKVISTQEKKLKEDEDANTGSEIPVSMRNRSKKYKILFSPKQKGNATFRWADVRPVKTQIRINPEKIKFYQPIKIRELSRIHVPLRINASATNLDISASSQSSSKTNIFITNRREPISVKCNYSTYKALNLSRYIKQLDMKDGPLFADKIPHNI